MKKLYELQDTLDIYIRSSKGITEAETKLLCHTCLAALVEIGEFYVENDRDKTLFEYVDILHFLLRINNILKMDYMVTFEFEDMYKSANIKVLDKTKDSETLDLISSLTKFVNATRCFKYWSSKGPDDIDKLCDLYALTFFNYLSMGNTMGFTALEVIDTYLLKRNENFERQKSGY
jgi:Uncharacterized protein conserved in bacteria